MLRLRLIDYHRVKEKYPEDDHMPIGYICPGYDIEMMEVLAVLAHIHGVKTQWSCQGNHKSGDTYRAYILIAPNNQFPKTLLSVIKKHEFCFGYVDDVDLNGQSTGLKRQVIRSFQEADEGCKNKNHLFVKVLKEWAIKEIRNNLKNMKGSYYNDVVEKYIIEQKKDNRL